MIISPLQSLATNAEGADFSELPDVIWVRVLHYLPLCDRYRVSETCSRLHAAFNHPSLWSAYSLHFWGGTQDFGRRTHKAVSTIEQTQLVRRFGKYFQHLRFIVHGHFRDMTRDTIELIREMGRECRLETLTIQAGALTSEFVSNYAYPPKETVVAALSSFVRSAYRMRHLHIRSWPMFDEIDNAQCNVFRSIHQNEKLKESLETITMFCLDEKEQWSEREPMLLSSAVTQEVLLDLKNLTCIGLRSPMLSEDLLMMLTRADRVRLKTLQIVVHYLPHSTQNFSVPHIRSRAWQGLVARNPDFRVECTIPFRVPELELANMLTPETPVSAFKVLKYSKLDPFTLLKLYTNYSKTLTKFLCYCDAHCSDKDILKLVTKCEHIREFVYHGHMNTSTVVSAAQVHGENWNKFEVKAESIKVENEFDELDEDEVVARGEDGELFLVGMMRFHQPEENRESVVHQMTSDVSKALGTPWKPF